MKKVMFISSTGGHLSEILELKGLFSKYNYLIVTEKDDMTEKLSDIYKVAFLEHGSKDQIFKYFFIFPYNIIKSILLYFKFKPTHIISTGAHTAVPMCYIGKLFGSKIIWIESFANINSPTLSGRLVYPIANRFFVQWESMKKFYPKALFKGGIY